ncbi:hypothetical protein [Sphingobacterium hungaricum]|uniref:Uncharacterized protein n=1 Tax=Sphingobacterium hungaricum TaxID=2082723 RepID=A0A928V1V0_9SPHI|nr:hypothetical protein [Sphingobacterium hungaricum]MBE8715431.1 hypothetical protein [Sphingobacterium hungaricum]
MTKSNQDILSKIGELLVEINENYQALIDHSSERLSENLFILQAQSKYLTAKLELFEKLNAQQTASSSVSNDTVFTPASQIEEKHQDEQETEEEITEISFKKSVYSSDKKESEVEEEKPEVENSEEVEEQVLEEIEESPVDTSDEEEFETEEEIEAEVAEEEEEIAESEEEDLETESQAEPEPEEVEEEPVAKAVETPAQPSSSVQNQPVSEEKPQSAPANSGTFVESRPSQEIPSYSEPVVKEVIIEQKEIVVEAVQPPVEPAKPSRPLTLNELIQQQKQAGVTNTQKFATSSSTSSEKVTDLKSAISLNDKLLFIKDLFNGYSLAYSEAIELLNRFDNFSEADAFLQTNYAMKNGWSQKSQTVEKLYIVLRKRFL